MRRFILSGTAAIIILLLFTAGTLFSVEAQQEQGAKKSTVVNLTTSEAGELIETNKSNPDFIILDVRTPEEYSQGHLENAVNLDVKSDSFSEKITKLDKEKTYIIHCRSGSRSKEAVKIMEETGFTQIYEIGGGYADWESKGLPVTK